jgi:hypothetical protein
VDVMERLQMINDIDHYYQDTNGTGVAISKMVNATDAELRRVHKKVKVFYRYNRDWPWRWWEKKCTSRS